MLANWMWWSGESHSGFYRNAVYVRRILALKWIIDVAVHNNFRYSFYSVPGFSNSNLWPRFMSPMTSRSWCIAHKIFRHFYAPPLFSLSLSHRAAVAQSSCPDPCPQHYCQYVHPMCARLVRRHTNDSVYANFMCAPFAFSQHCVKFMSPSESVRIYDAGFTCFAVFSLCGHWANKI